MVAFSSVLICGIQWTAATKALLIVGVCLILLAVSCLLVMEIIGKRNAVPQTESDSEPRAEESETPSFAEAAASADEDYAEEGILPEQEVLLEEGLVVEDDGETADAGFVIVNGERVKVRYDRSFEARLIQSDDALKSRYNELKNELLCYDLKPRVSWSNESCYSGRTTYAKFAVRGKTLSLYLALEPKEFAESKYSFTDVHGVSKYKGVPMRLKIKSDRAVRWAKELIAAMAEKYGLHTIQREAENFRPEYRDTTSLVLQRLIKLYLASDKECTEEEWEDAVISDLKLRDRAPREFLTRLMRSPISLKTNYSELKNELLRYGLKCRMSKSNESYYIRHVTYAKFAIRGKNLSLYLALAPSQFADTKYIFKDESGVSKYAAVPLRLRISSARSVRWAKELIFALGKKEGLHRTELPETDYRYVK